MGEPRKIQKTGRNTFIVSLPSDWVAKKSITKGTQIYVNENDDGTLTLTMKKTEKGQRNYKISVSSTSFESSMRNVVSAYVGGADRITLNGKDMSTVAEEARKLLSGVEIAEETDNELVLQILSFENLSVESILKRIFNLTQTMFSLILAAYTDGTNTETEVARKEDEVDRLYLLLLRNMCIGNMPAKDAVFRAIAAKSMEKISDHLVELSEYGKELAPNPKIASLLEKAQIVYSAAFESFTAMDSESLKFTDAVGAYNKELNGMETIIKKEKVPAKIIAMKNMTEKCNKVVRYSEDLTESGVDLRFTKDENYNE